MLNHEQCKNLIKEDTIPVVINSLLEKGFNFKDYYDKVNKSHYILIDNTLIEKEIGSDDELPVGNVDWHNLEIYSTGNVNTLVQETFKDIQECFSKNKKIDRVMYHVISPHTTIPKHLDDDDYAYKIVIPVHVPSKDPNIVGLKFGEEIYATTPGKMIGCDTATILHEGWNFSNDYWSLISVHLHKPLNEDDYV
jgi:hypothetical protein